MQTIDNKVMTFIGITGFTKLNPTQLINQLRSFKQGNRLPYPAVAIFSAIRKCKLLSVIFYNVNGYREQQTRFTDMAIKHISISKKIRVNEYTLRTEKIKLVKNCYKTQYILKNMYLISVNYIICFIMREVVYIEHPRKCI